MTEQPEDVQHAFITPEPVAAAMSDPNSAHPAAPEPDVEAPEALPDDPYDVPNEDEVDPEPGDAGDTPELPYEDPDVPQDDDCDPDED